MEKKIMIVVICLLLIGIIGYLIYSNYYLGDYIIKRQWISNSYEEFGIKQCNNCLWIEFSEGCNRYITYYFENEFVINPKFEEGDVVNINWREYEGKNYIGGLRKAYKYRSCT